MNERVNSALRGIGAFGIEPGGERGEGEGCCCEVLGDRRVWQAVTTVCVRAVFFGVRIPSYLFIYVN